MALTLDELDLPKNWEILKDQKFEVKSDEQLMLRVTVVNNRGRSFSPRVFCRILFFDSAGNFINEIYRGAAHTELFGSYFGVVAINGLSTASWYDTPVVAPKHAQTLELQVCGNNEFGSDIKLIECVGVNRAPILESIIPVSGGYPFKLSIPIKSTTKIKHAAICSILYLDEFRNVIPGPYYGLLASQRYHFFTYVNSGGSEATVLRLVAPMDAVFILVKFHPIDVAPESLDVACPSINSICKPSFFPNDWELLGPEGVRRFIPIPSDLTHENIVRLKLSFFLEDVSFLRRDEIVVRVDSFDSNDILLTTEDISISELIPNEPNRSGFQVLHKEFLIWRPAVKGYLLFSLSVRDRAVIYVYKNVEIETIGEAEVVTSIDLCTSSPQNILLTGQANWKSVIEMRIPLIRGSSSVLPEVIVTYPESKNNPACADGAGFEVIKGKIGPSKTEAGAFSLCPDIVDISTSVLAFRFGSRLSNQCILLAIQIDGQKPTRVIYRKWSAESIVNTNVSLDGVLEVLEENSVSQKKAERIFSQIERIFPNNELLYRRRFEFYQQRGELESAIIPAIKLKGFSKDRSLILSVKRMLSIYALLQEDRVPQRRSEKRPSKLVKPVFVIRTNEFDQRNGQEKISILDMPRWRDIIIPFFCKKNHSDKNLWGIEIVDNRRFFYLNSISKEDMELVPLETRIAFTSLMMSHIIQHEKFDLIICRLVESDYQLALLSVIVSTNLNLPLIFEISDEQLRAMRSQVGRHTLSVIEKMEFQQTMRCVARADILVVRKRFASKFADCISSDHECLIFYREDKQNSTSGGTWQFEELLDHSDEDIYQRVFNFLQKHSS